MNYLETLQDELSDARNRLRNCDPEGLPVLHQQIQQIKRDIKEQLTLASAKRK